MMLLDKKHVFQWLVSLLSLSLSMYASAESGYWAFKGREINKPSEYWVKKGHSIQFDQQDHGLSSRCSHVDMMNKTVVDAGHLSWSLDFAPGYLLSGQQIKARLSLQRLAGSGQSWAGSITIGNATLVSVTISDPRRPPTAEAVGKIPGKLQNPRTGVINPLVISVELGSGNEVCSPNLRWIYEWKEGAPPALPTPPTASMPPSGASPNSGVEATSQPGASATSSADSGIYLGCYKDAADRDLSGYTVSLPGMTTQACVDICRQNGFTYAATQFKTHCFCGNAYGKHGKAANCDMTCGGNSAETCGGSWANSVYATGSASPTGSAGSTGTAGGAVSIVATSPVSAPTMIGSGSVAVPSQTGKARSLTGAWVHSSVGTTQMPDSKVIVLHEGNQVTLVSTYKAGINRNQWQTFRCVGLLVGQDLNMECRWVEGGNPMSYADGGQLVFRLSDDQDHLNGYHVQGGVRGQDAYYSRIP